MIYATWQQKMIRGKWFFCKIVVLHKAGAIKRGKTMLKWNCTIRCHGKLADVLIMMLARSYSPDWRFAMQVFSGSPARHGHSA